MKAFLFFIMKCELNSYVRINNIEWRIIFPRSKMGNINVQTRKWRAIQKTKFAFYCKNKIKVPD